MNDQIEIRLFGRLWVRLGNGTVVPSSQLDRRQSRRSPASLAARADQIVSSTSVIEQALARRSGGKAAASLHSRDQTQIRKVLGKNSITRHLSGLQLHGCWVDVVAHRQLAAEISAAMRSRDFARVISAAKQAEALYVDDFHAHDDDERLGGSASATSSGRSAS